MQKIISERYLGMHWNRGINNEFLFPRKSFLDAFYSRLDGIYFYLEKFYLITENNLSPISFLNKGLENYMFIIFCLVISPLFILSVQKSP